MDLFSQRATSLQRGQLCARAPVCSGYCVIPREQWFHNSSITSDSALGFSTRRPQPAVSGAAHHASGPIRRRWESTRDGDLAHREHGSRAHTVQASWQVLHGRRIHRPPDHPGVRCALSGVATRSQPHCSIPPPTHLANMPIAGAQVVLPQLVHLLLAR